MKNIDYIKEILIIIVLATLLGLLRNYLLDEPFLVLATQNPVEQEGTYPLPEAQTDRFMLKPIIDYPKKEEEKLIIRNNLSNKKPVVKSVVSIKKILDSRKLIN